MRDYLFFDLDGTLVDSEEGILGGVAYAAEKLGLPRRSRAEMLRYIGPPLDVAFTEDYGLDAENARLAVAAYREYYNARGIFECRLYNGVSEMLDRLCDAGYNLALATGKPTVMARRILIHFGILDRFGFVSGPELDGTRGKKREVIVHAMEQLGVDASDRVLMIGDRLFDVQGAHEVGVPCAGVLWGFGSEDELTEAGADRLFRTPAALADALTAERVSPIPHRS